MINFNFGPLRMSHKEPNLHNYIIAKALLYLTVFDSDSQLEVVGEAFELLYGVKIVLWKGGCDLLEVLIVSSKVWFTMLFSSVVRRLLLHVIVLRC